MQEYQQIAEINQKKAFEIIKKLQIMEIWQAHGAVINLVGSLKMGLMCKHHDIDFHIYTPKLDIQESFAAITELAAQPGVKKVEFANLLDCPDACLEWHIWYEDNNHEIWQLDLMHIRKGSAYDGYFEKVAQRIMQVITPEQRDTILKLKFATPEGQKIMGIEYYQAVIRDGVQTWEELTKWRGEHADQGIIEWMP